MKHLKLLSLALFLPILTGCNLINNTVSKVALDVIFKSDFIVTRLDFTSEDGVKPFTKKPTTETTREPLMYGFEALVIPKSVKVEQYVTVDISFAITYSEGAEALFFSTVMAPETDEAAFGAEMFALLPLGSVSKPAADTDLDKLGDYMDLDKVIEISKEPDRNVMLTITGTAGTKTKSIKYYFNLTTDGYPLPGGGDVDINTDFAFFTDTVNEEVSKTFTVSKTAVAANPVTLPLQIAWFSVDGASDKKDGSLAVTVDMSNLGAFDVTLPANVGPFDVTMMKTLLDFPITLKLKEGQPAPSEDVVVTIKILITPVAETNGGTSEAFR